MLLEGSIQFQVSIERHDDLILECALVLQIHPREREAQGLGALRCRGNELQGKAPRQRPKLLEDRHRVSSLGLQPIGFEHRAKYRLQLGDGPRCDHESMTEAANDVRRVVDQVVGTPSPAAVVEELNPHVAIQCENPIADLVNLMEESPVLGIQSQSDDRSQIESRLPRRDGRRRARERGR